MAEMDRNLRKRIDRTKIWRERAGRLTARVEFESLEEVCDFADLIVESLRGIGEAEKTDISFRFRGKVIEIEIIPIEDISCYEVEMAEEFETSLSNMELG